MKILLTGSIAYDVLLSYDGSFSSALKGSDLNKVSVSFFSPHFAKHHGGTAANIGWNVKLLGGAPLIVGAVGSDGGEYLALLGERQIDVSRIQVIPEHVTATAIIGTDDAENQIAFFHPGADSHGTWPDLMDDREDIVVALVGPRDAKAMVEAVRWCQKAKVPYLFDPGQQVIGLSRDELVSCIAGSRGVVTNEYEWGLLSEKIGASIEILLRSTSFLIVTKGEEGLTVYTPEETIDVPACKAEKVVNPTGAGDALRAGFLMGLAAKWPLLQCARLGAAIASFVVEQEGTLLDRLDVEEVRERAKGTYEEELPSLN